MSEEARPRAMLVGGDMTMAAAAIHLLGATAAEMGIQVFALDREQDDFSAGLLGMFDDRPLDHPGFRRDGVVKRRTDPRTVTHINTPKPISKRKARRLRGKASS